MTKVTSAEMIAEVRRIASQDPDRVYGVGDAPGSCSYFGQAVGDMTGQCCIIGQAFHNLEVNTDQLLSTEGRGNSPTIRQAVQEKYVDIEVVDRVELQWLDLVQGGQDRGESWSKAVASVDEMYPVKL